MKALFLIFLIILAISLGIQALYLLLLTLSAFRVKRHYPPASKNRSFAVVVPAHNEALTLSACLSSLKAVSYPKDKFQIYVIADNCTDETAAIARNFGALVFERKNLQDRGKGYALDWFFKNHQAAYSHVSIVSVIDADCSVDKGYFSTLNAAFESDRISVVQSGYEISNPKESRRAALMSASFAYTNFLKRAGEFVLFKNTHLLGSGMHFKTKIPLEHGYPAHSLAEDLELSFLLKRKGYSIAFCPAACVYADSVVSFTDSKSQVSRWEQGRFLILKEHFQALLKKSFSTNFKRYLPLFLDLLSLPMAPFVAAISVGLLSSLLLFWPPLLLVYGVFLMIAGFAVLSSLWLTHQPLFVWTSLLLAPMYILWKVPLSLFAFLNKKSMAWIRTKRKGETDPS